MRNMRRKDRELSKELALAVADKCAFSVLATVNQDGSPYCVPLSMVREGEWLYFHSAAEGHKIENLRRQGKVCVACVGGVRDLSGVFSIGFESAIINGGAEEITGREEKIRALRLISERYTPNNMGAFDKTIDKDLDHTGVWKIHIDEISGKGK